MTALASINLTDDTLWTDEFQDSPVALTRNYTRGGRQIIYASDKKKGRPITLVSYYNPRSTVEAISAVSRQPGLVMTLILPDGRQFQTMFDHTQQAALSAEPELPMNQYFSSDLYTITLKLFEV